MVKIPGSENEAPASEPKKVKRKETGSDFAPTDPRNAPIKTGNEAIKQNPDDVIHDPRFVTGSEFPADDPRNAPIQFIPTGDDGSSFGFNKAHAEGNTPTYEEFQASAQSGLPAEEGSEGAVPTFEEFQAAARSAGAVPEIEEKDFGDHFINFFAGFNREVANLLALPVEALDEVFRLAGAKLLDNPGDAAKAIADAMTDVGIDATPFKALSADLGANAFNATLSLMTIWALAPKIAIQIFNQNPSLWHRVVNEMAQMTVKHPGFTVATEVAAVGGGTVGEKFGGATGAVAGSVAGGFAPMSLLAGSKRAVKNAGALIGAAAGGTAGLQVGGPFGLVSGGFLGGKGGALVQDKAIAGAKDVGESIADMVPEKVKRKVFGPEKPKEPAEPSIIDVEATPGRSRVAVKREYDKQVKEAEDEISAILDDIDPGVSPKQSSEDFAAQYDEVYTIARDVESNAYNQRLMQNRENNDPMVRVANRLAALNPRDKARPNEYIERILEPGGDFSQKGVGRKTQEFPEGKPIRVGKQAKGLHLQRLSSDLSEDIRAADRDGKKKLSRSLRALKTAVDATLEKIDPEGFKRSHDASKKFNDLFTRGNNAALDRRRGGEFVISGEKTVPHLLGKDSGFDQMWDIEKTYRGASDEVGKLLPLLSRSIDSLYTEAARKSGKDAQRWMWKNRRSINEYKEEFHKLVEVTADLVAQHERLRGIKKGALAIFGDQDTQKAWQSILSSKDPTKMVDDILLGLAGKPIAIKAFAEDFTKFLFVANDMSAVRLQSHLQKNPKVARALEVALDAKGEGGFKHFKAVMDEVANIETGKSAMAGVRKVALSAFMDLSGRFSGAKLGRNIAESLGSGGASIQQTGATANFVKNLLLAVSGRIAPEEVFARALTDPDFAKLVLAKIPQTAAELKSFRNAVTHFINSREAIMIAEQKGAEIAEEEKVPDVWIGNSTEVPQQTGAQVTQ